MELLGTKVGDKFKTSFLPFLFPSSFPLSFSDIEPPLISSSSCSPVGMVRMRHIDEWGTGMQPGNDRVERSI